MKLAEVFRSDFSRSAMIAGLRLCYEERVSVAARSAYAVTVNVSTMDGTEEVQINWAELSRVGTLAASCTCQAAARRELCEHLYAALETCSPKRLPSTSRPYEITALAPETDLHRLLPGWSGLDETSWLAQLGSLDDDNDDESESPRFAATVETWFVLNVADCLQRQALVVSLLERRRARGGGWTGFTPKRVSMAEAITESGSAADRMVASLIATGGLLGHSDFGHYPPMSRAIVKPMYYDVVLPGLADTGRFVWVLDDMIPADEGRPIHWDGDAGWKLRLELSAVDAKQQWELRGTLRCGDKDVSLDEPVLVGNDFALLEDQLVRLDCSGGFRWVPPLRANRVIRVPYRDREELAKKFCSQQGLPEIVWPNNFRIEVTRGEPRGKLVVSEATRRGRLSGQPVFVYGDHEYTAASLRKSHVNGEQLVFRNEAEEGVLIGQVEDLGLTVDERYGVERPFPHADLPKLVAQLNSLNWEVQAQGIKLRTMGTSAVSIKWKVDWFEVDGSVDFDGVDVELPALLRAVRNNQSMVRLDDGTHGVLPEKWLERYRRVAELSTADGQEGGFRFSPSQVLLLDGLLEGDPTDVTIDADRQFTEFRRRLEEFQGVKPRNAPRGFRGKLRSYQRDGLGWLRFLADYQLGGCLADDMGLGKTIQVLALLQSRRTARRKASDRLPSLVVVPKSLVFNWLDEAARFTPRLTVVDYTGSRRRAALAETTADLIVTTYGTLRRDIGELREMSFDYVILDEAQAVKNHHSQASKACRLLSARHRLALTGTPVENHLGDLWSLFEFLNPGMLGRFAGFSKRIKRPGPGNEAEIAALARGLRPFLLRRTKQQVLNELPAKTEQTLYCDMSKDERRRYDELRDYYRGELNSKVEKQGLGKAKIHVLEALLRLRQAACHPGLLDPKLQQHSSSKLDVMLEQVAEVIDEGHKVLVFSQFTSLLAIVRHHLDKRKLKYLYLDGQTTNRGKVVEQFQTDRDYPLFLISLKAGGHGLNLTAAEYVFILDPWWNPAVEAQAIDRTHRIGQSKPVFAYRLICRDTVEDKIVQLQQDKRHLADAIISQDNSLIGDLTLDDLEMLLS